MARPDFWVRTECVTAGWNVTARPAGGSPSTRPVERVVDATCKPKPILSLEALEERWGISSKLILKHVDNPENPLPTLQFSDPKRKGKNRSALRFRLSSVEAWEIANECRAAYQADPSLPPPEPPGRPAGFTGKMMFAKALAKRKNPI